LSVESLDETRFHIGRPDDLRRAPPWHRLAYIVGALPAELHRLSADLNVADHGRVLDYGCADLPYRSFFPAAAEYLAADLPGNPDATVEIGADGTVPVEDSSIDAIVSTQVLEHVADPDLYLSECFRVLRPGGRMLLSTHGIMVYHPDPVDYWRWTCAGLERSVRRPGFEIVRFDGIMGLAATGLQLIQESVYYKLPRGLRDALALVFQTLIAVVERLQSPAGRRSNALVFALVAEKPAIPGRSATDER
jgi:SAM-dependent methyltransferase